MTKPKNVLEIGVFCGVTSRNICEFLNKKNKDDFQYYGLDLFGSEKKEEIDEIEPLFLKNQIFSNPLKKIFYNYILKENLNSIESVSKLLKKFSNNIRLIKGDTKDTLKEVPLEKIDFVFFTTLSVLCSVYIHDIPKTGFNNIIFPEKTLNSPGFCR